MTQDNSAHVPAPSSRLAQIAALKAKMEALRRQPGFPSRGTPESNRLLNQISALEGSFVLYQGQEIEAELCNEMDGNLRLAITDDLTLDAEGHERLYRTPQGEYYLRRKMCVLDVDGENERQASGRTLVHRITLNAAVQWAIMRCNADTRNLRQDATRALQSSRGYLSSSDLDEVTVPLTLPLSLYRETLAMTTYDKHIGFSESGSNFSERVAHSLVGDMEAWLEAPDRNPTPKQFLRNYEKELDAGKHPEVYPPQAFTLPTNPTPSRRQPPRAAKPVNEEALTAPGGHLDEDGLRTFTFDYLPTERRGGYRETLGVDADQWETIQEFAAIFALEPREFLRQMNARELPGQPVGPNGAAGTEDRKLNNQMLPEDIAFECFDDAMRQRIKRAAASQELTMDEYVVSAVACLVDTDECPLLVHPQTGEMLHEDFKQLFDEVSFEETAPRLGESQASWASTPEQAGEEETPEEIEMSIFDYLDPQLALRVLRYLYLTPWQYKSADVVNGCVEYALNQMFEALNGPGGMQGKVPDDEGFADNAWGWAEELICAFANQRIGGKPVQEKEHRANSDRPTPRRSAGNAEVPYAGTHLVECSALLTPAGLRRLSLTRLTDKTVGPEGAYVLIPVAAGGLARLTVDGKPSPLLAGYAAAESADERLSAATLRLISPSSGDPVAEVDLSDGQLAVLQAHAQEHGMSLETAFKDMLSKWMGQQKAVFGISEADDDAPLEIVDLRGLLAADRTDVALCAAGSVPPVTDQPLRPTLLGLAAEWLAKAERTAIKREGIALVVDPNAAVESAQLKSCAAALLAALDEKEGK